MREIEIELKADTREITELLNNLLSDLSDAPHEIRKLALDFFNLTPELISSELGPASGAVITVLLKPSQRLLDFCLAVRARDFDLLIVKHAHDNPPMEIAANEKREINDGKRS